MLSKKQQLAFDSFYDSALNNTVLEPKTTVLVHLAAALSSGCYP